MRAARGRGALQSCAPHRGGPTAPSVVTSSGHLCVRLVASAPTSLGSRMMRENAGQTPALSAGPESLRARNCKTWSHPCFCFLGSPPARWGGGCWLLWFVGARSPGKDKKECYGLLPAPPNPDAATVALYVLKYAGPTALPFSLGKARVYTNPRGFGFLFSVGPSKAVPAILLELGMCRGCSRELRIPEKKSLRCQVEK